MYTHTRIHILTHTCHNMQAMPGPLFNFSAYLGALFASKFGYSLIVGAAVAWLGLFGPGVALMFAAMPYWTHVRRFPVYRFALPGVCVCVCVWLCCQFLVRGLTCWVYIYRFPLNRFAPSIRCVLRVCVCVCVCVCCVCGGVEWVQVCVMLDLCGLLSLSLSPADLSHTNVLYIDSATNKGLGLCAAVHFFDLPPPCDHP